MQKLILSVYSLVFIIVSMQAQVLIQTLEDTRRDIIRYGTEDEILKLISELEKDNEKSMDQELVLLLDKTRNAKILENVFNWMSSQENPIAENRAITVLKERDTESKTTVLSAIKYLGNIESVASIDELQKIIENEEAEYLLQAIEALGKTGNEKISLFLIFFIQKKEQEKNIKDGVIKALGTLGYESSLTYLENELLDESISIFTYMNILDALKKIGVQESSKHIIKALNHSDANVRAFAISLLGPFSSNTIETAILEGFRDSFYKTRIGACIAAGEKKLISAIPFLEFRAKNDSVPSVREEAVKALSEIGSDDSLKVLVNLLEDKKTSDKIKTISAEGILKNNASLYIASCITALEKAKDEKRTVLYNGLAKALTTVKDISLEEIARSFLLSKDIVDRHYALDIIIQNKFSNLLPELENIQDEKNDSLKRKIDKAIELLRIIE
jgi:HEAT repeat protein